MVLANLLLPQESSIGCFLLRADDFGEDVPVPTMHERCAEGKRRHLELTQTCSRCMLQTISPARGPQQPFRIVEPYGSILRPGRNAPRGQRVQRLRCSRLARQEADLYHG